MLTRAFLTRRYRSRFPRCSGPSPLLSSQNLLLLMVQLLGNEQLLLEELLLYSLVLMLELLQVPHVWTQ